MGDRGEVKEMIERPDVQAILATLKDFQRATAEYVFRRMYLDPEATNRFLVADEVGLGKTLVARGLIAKIIDHLWDSKRRIDIVYICSNADIARQNLNRLNVGVENFELTSRMTMLPTKLHDLKDRKLNFVSFTPGTSFDLKDALGRQEERALLYVLLQRAWGFKGRDPLYVLKGDVRRIGDFRHLVQRTQRSKIDPDLTAEFHRALERHATVERSEGRKDMRTRFEELSEEFRTMKNRPSTTVRWEQRRLVGEMRELLAATCIEALEPDLIILDEFQRFRHLLRGDSPSAALARPLFEYQDQDNDSVRVLLLSATPYKMYTLSGESEDEDHYVDFIRTLEFLQHDPAKTRDFEALIQEYRRGLFALADDPSIRRQLSETKSMIEAQLRKVIARTERLAATEDRDGMLEEAKSLDLRLIPADLSAYVGTQRIAKELGQSDVIEFWKSAPYLFNFMDGYALKKSFQRQLGDAMGHSALAKQLKESPEVLLPWPDIGRYMEIDPGNARLRSIIAHTIEPGAWRLLWIPPALPYYRLQGPFGDPGLQGFTKRLVFSAWRVVPKAIATLLSYEAERRMIKSSDDQAINTPEEHRRRTSRALLRLTLDDGRPAGMSTFALLYPSVTLARTCDPLDLIDGEPMLVEEVLKRAAMRIDELLKGIKFQSREGAPDEAWYWIAPMLLDRAHEPELTEEWFDYEDLDYWWAAGEEAPESEREHLTGWAEHVRRARNLSMYPTLGPRPDDLSEVLAKVALGSPAVCTFRAIARVVGNDVYEDVDSWFGAAYAGWGFRSLFNSPEITSLIRGMNSQEPYWQRVLEYCVDGCLQSALDEYVHVLDESHALGHLPRSERSNELGRAVYSVLTTRTATPRVDAVTVENSTVEVQRRSLRTRYAVRFGQERSEEEEGGARAEQVREAFNSPFWPFVIATTSIGQEGLDFHMYCHAVVHWNLPSNPVDLEQREGRVHRYKGHAVRRNLATHYESLGLSTKEGDPWKQMFSAATRDRPSGVNDVLPFWVFQGSGGAKIERYVPALPLSRELEQIRSLKDSLVVYRMVFGQPRQDDLLVYLLERIGRAELATEVATLGIDLSPPAS